MGWQDMITTAAALVAVGLLGCGPSILLVDGDSGDTGGSDHASTIGQPTTNGDDAAATTQPATTGVDPDSTGGTFEVSDSGSGSDSTDSTGYTFLIQPDGSVCGALPPGTLGHCSFECDLWEQDCPADEKCGPWSNNGEAQFNGTFCHDIAPDPAVVGEPCVTSGVYTGDDNCDIGLICMDVDPETLEGTCQPMCVGTVETPQCENPDLHCVVTSDGYLPLCYEPCNPLLGGCAEGDVCIPPADLPVCFPGVDEPAEFGEPCVGINACAPGLACALDLDPMCEGDSCCTSWCDLSVPEPNPACAGDPNDVCTPLYQDGLAPEGLEEVGLCIPPKA